MRVKYKGKGPAYVDGFPKDCARSCEGAIHFLPDAVRVLTEDEYEFIKDKYSFLKLLVHDEKPLKVKPKSAHDEPAAKAAKVLEKPLMGEFKYSKKKKRK